MFDFEFDHTLDINSPVTFESGVYLWVFHANKIPPHIGISKDGMFYSLKSSGVDMDLDTNKVFLTIQRKQIPSFIIEINCEQAIDLRSEFSKYSKTEIGKSTCLTPVKNVLNYSDAQKLSELLNYLAANNRLRQVYRLNGTSGMKGILKYDTDKITDRLLALEKQLV